MIPLGVWFFEFRWYYEIILNDEKRKFGLACAWLYNIGQKDGDNGSKQLQEKKEEEETSYRTLDCTIHTKEQNLFGTEKQVILIDGRVDELMRLKKQAMYNICIISFPRLVIY